MELEKASVVKAGEVVCTLEWYAMSVDLSI
jgi:hypothetical protein